MGRQYIYLKIHVKPMKKKEKLYINNELIIYETPEKPVKGRVNKALIKTLSKKLSIPSNNIEIVVGFKAQDKIIRLNNVDMSKEDILEKIID